MLKRLFKIKKGSFLKNVIIVASGTAMAQVIALIASPIITRLYGPEAYGIMGVFQASISMLVPLAALTYPAAIVLPKKDEDAKGIMRLSIYLAMILSVLSLFIILTFNGKIIKLFNLGEIAPFLFLIPIVLIFSGFMEVYEQWLIRTNQFKITATSAVYRAIIINSGRIGIGLFYPIASVLIVLSALENGLRAFILWFHLKKNDFTIGRNHDRKSLLKLAKEYKDFPIYRAPLMFFHRISQSSPVLLLSMFFGAATAGYFTIGRTVLGIPSNLIGKSIGDVFYPRIAEASNKGENLNKLILKATVALALAGIIPYGLVILFGPWLFSFVFGADWVIAGEYARWMSVWIFFMFINRPSTRALPVMSAQAFQLRYEIITLVLRLAAFISAYYIFEDAMIAIAFFSVTAGVLSVGLILLTFRIGKKFDSNI